MSAQGTARQKCRLAEPCRQNCRNLQGICSLAQNPRGFVVLTNIIYVAGLGVMPAAKTDAYRHKKLSM